MVGACPVSPVSIRDNDDDFSRSDADSDVWGSDAVTVDVKGEEGAGEEPVIARAETRAVRSTKLLVYLVLIASAVGVGLAVYFYTSSTEVTQFQTSFQDSTVKVLDSVGKSIHKTLSALDILSTDFVSHARATEQSWPYVLFPDFSIRAEKIRSMSVAVQFSLQLLVEPEQRKKWETFAWENQGWVNQSMQMQATNPNFFGTVRYDHKLIYPIHNDLYDVPYNETRAMLPSWYNTPLETQTRSGGFNWDLLSQTDTDSVKAAISTRKAVLAEAYMLPNMSNPDEVDEYEAWKEWFKNIIHPDEDPGEPASDIHWPILDHPLDTTEVADSLSTPRVVGTLLVEFFWRNMIRDILPKGNNGTVLVFHNPCNPSFTYMINGPSPVYLGRGDHHDPKYDGMAVSTKLVDLDVFSISRSTYTGLPLDDGYCQFTLVAYPSATMESKYVTNNPIYFAVGAILIFCFTSFVFLLYDYTVERRQRKVLSTAARTNAIVSSLFPSVVRDRIFPTEVVDNKPKTFGLVNTKSKLKSFLTDGTSSNGGDSDMRDAPNLTKASAPIAELFPDCTVMFADVAGFTAWSSVRDPAQVFTLLEAIYGAFDTIARKRGVFKVETIGDCYVAVCGLPESREGHAIVMCRFARDCKEKMNELTRELETTLGPDTGDLKLFGDTVNCAARMESNGAPNRIQCSQKTADLLISSGKGFWLEKRVDLVEAKGKGKLQTYWVEPPSRHRGDNDSFNNSESTSLVADVDALHMISSPYCDASGRKIERLIEWNVDAFTGLLKRIVARRMTLGNNNGHAPSNQRPSASSIRKPRSEVAEVIFLPEFEFSMKSTNSTEFPDLELPRRVAWQLRDLISVIGYCYQSNSFHNFEHASHVTMSIMKLLQRVMSQDVSLGSDCKDERKAAEALASNLHASSYGLSSDPLSQFAIVFAALVHDLDHTGISNAQLVAEKDPVALTYDNQSPAEQHSVSMAWELLMRDDYEELRSYLFCNLNEQQRFRQLLVNAVIATDIFDPDLKRMREARWEKAFHTMDSDEDSSTQFNRKATIIIEYLIQASDVAHTMQHWTIYRKWNSRLFDEMFAAYRAGRSTTNPAAGWYNGELWFFDNYIIPLARKLKECHVFGVSCDEFLDYAVDNRSEWEAKGKDIVVMLLHEAELRHGPHESPETLILRAQERRNDEIARVLAARSSSVTGVDETAESSVANMKSDADWSERDASDLPSQASMNKRRDESPTEVAWDHGVRFI